ncbi:MAG: Crp/Fnr family transcriptional regulator [Marivirga sp.]|nr:Crp/Fnr family transcriptional regulator [Marivirga sp.]
MKDQFIQILRSIIELPPQQESEIRSVCSIKRIVKGEHFIRAGEIPSKMAFNLQGLLRYYYLDKKGNDYTKGFFPERSPITSYSAMIQDRESYFNIEALEDSVLVVFTYSDWKQLLNKHPCWKQLLIVLLEKGYCAKETREREFLVLDAEEKYRIFIQNFPDIEGRIKQHFIASYLGITPVALSRIRRKMGLINIG